jgi:DNA-binding transcriptional regulator YiaG
MSAPMKTHRTDTIQIIVEGKKRSLFLVPKDKAASVESLLEEYRQDDFIPADEVFKELYAKHGKPGVTLRGFRTRDGLSQSDLSKKLNCPQPWISAWETGSRPLGKKMAQKLAKVFKTDYRLFL